MLSILLHVNILDIRAVMISREKSFNSARRDFSAPSDANRQFSLVLHSRNINNIKITILNIHIYS